MPSPRRMTPELLEKAIGLRQRSWSLEAIAQEVGVSQGCIAWHFLKEGVDPPKVMHRLQAVPQAPVSVKRGNHVVRRYTAADDALLLALEAKGLSCVQIGRHLGRRHNSVRGRLMTLARRQARLDGDCG